MHRRALLAGLSTALAGALAGCGGGGGDGDGGSEDGGTSDSGADTATPMSDDAETPMETQTQTSDDMETPTETATPTPEDSDGGTSFTHEVGEEFTVGESGNQVTYRIIEFQRADRIGSQANYNTADGTYLIVTLEVTNPRSKAIEFPEGDFRVLTDDGAWQRFDRDPSQKVNSDERLDVEHIGDATIPVGEAALGTVVFDVDPDKNQRLWITPTGDPQTPEHFVPVPDLSEIEELRSY